MGASRGLVSGTVRDQVAELTDLASHSRARRPIYHVHADPPPGASFDEAAWGRYWVRFEAEFGLGRQPFAEQIHIKNGREHRHREYSLVRSDGTTMPLSHDHARREKVSRLTEIEEGQRLTPGAHNRAVIAVLEREGRADLAEAMRSAGLDGMARPRAAATPRERAQSERTAIDPATLGKAVLDAWRASDGAEAFAAALSDRGLRLAQGDKVPVVIDAAGAAHPLARMLGRESKAAGGDRIAAGDVAARLAGLDLPRHDPAHGRQAVAAPRDLGAVVVPAVLPESSPATVPALVGAVPVGAAHAGQPTSMESSGGGAAVVVDDLAGLALDAVWMDDARIAPILAGEPHSNPRSRDVRIIVGEICDAILGRQRAAEQLAEEAIASAERTRSAVTILDRLAPWSTPRKRAAKAADEVADRLRSAARIGAEGLGRDIKDGEARAAAIVRGREMVRVSWRAQPDVVAALERRRLNQAVAEAVMADDPQITDMAAFGDLAAARAVVQLRELVGCLNAERAPDQARRLI